MRYYVFRRGWNTANNPSSAGGPETVRVAEVEADSPEQAERDARAAGVTCYNNQALYAEPADEIDRAEAERDARVKLL